MKAHERLDEIAGQVRNVATVLKAALDKAAAGKLAADELEAVRKTAERLIAAWELEAGLLRRRPR
jgi:hypothetical protein